MAAAWARLPFPDYKPAARLASCEEGPRLDERPGQGPHPAPGRRPPGLAAAGAGRGRGGRGAAGGGDVRAVVPGHPRCRAVRGRPAAAGPHLPADLRRDAGRGVRGRVVAARGRAAVPLHATGTRLPHKPTAAVVAIIPWALLLTGFGLLLCMLRQARLRQAAAEEGR